MFHFFCVLFVHVKDLTKEKKVLSTPRVSSAPFRPPYETFHRVEGAAVQLSVLRQIHVVLVSRFILSLAAQINLTVIGIIFWSNLY